MSRQDSIEFAMNYCQHYAPGPGRVPACAAGMDIAKIQRVATKPGGIRWAPCIRGHELAEPYAICPKWLRTTLEQAEARADEVERSIARISKVMPVVNEWRQREPIGKQEVIACPVCGGRLHLRQAACNGHVHGHCETQDCVSWME